MRRKKIKFHTHHFTSVEIKKGSSIEKNFSVFNSNFFFYIGNNIIRFILLLGSSIFSVFLAAKLAIFFLIHKVWHILLAEVKKTSSLGKRRAKILYSLEFRRSVALFVFLCACGWGMFKAAGLLASALDLKNSIFTGAQAGIGHLNQAEQALASQNTEEANSQFAQALHNFTTGKQQLEEGNTMVTDILSVLPQTRDAQNVLSAAALISQSGQEMVKLYSAASSLSFSPQGLESSAGVTPTITAMDDALSSAAEKIKSANVKLLSVNPSFIPAQKRTEFVALTGKLSVADSAISNVKDIFSLLRQMVIPKTNVLLLFENNNELRPGGGFIGTYGNFVLENGKITSQTISSIYDLDGQLQQKISPPTPLLNVSDRWYIRDSNWFADFEASSHKVSGFYELEGGQTPNVTVAITPSVITSLLKITGPVTLPSFNITLDADNFVEQTQAISTISYNTPLNKPKQILADFFPVFIQKLKLLSKDQYKQVLITLLQQLQQKQIVFAAQDTAVQSQLETFNWAGKIFGTDRDYFNMVSSNLGGTKTDLSIQKKIHLETTISSNGSITDDLTVDITNQLPKLAGTENTSFVRFLVPKGSKLLSVTGFDGKNLDSLKNKSYKVDSAVANWESGMVKDVSSGTLIGTESEKTFFGNWLTVPGGETRHLHLRYQLPMNLQNLDRYSLVLQKQIGSQNDLLDYTVHFSGKALKWESFTPNSIEADKLEQSLVLDKDYFFGMVLESR
jgi:hypothetical protein